MAHTNGKVLSCVGLRFHAHSLVNFNLTAFMYRTVSQGFLITPQNKLHTLHTQWQLTNLHANVDLTCLPFVLVVVQSLCVLSCHLYLSVPLTVHVWPIVGKMEIIIHVELGRYFSVFSL